MLVRQYARIELMSGVTTIRTVGGLRDLDSRVRDEIYSGKQIGPRILTGNEGISVPGGHMAGSVAAIAKNTDEAVQLVQKGKRQGVDFIKLMITGGVMDAKKKGVPGELKMPPEMIRAVCDEAHRNGYIVAAHGLFCSECCQQQRNTGFLEYFLPVLSEASAYLTVRPDQENAGIKRDRWQDGLDL